MDKPYRVILETAFEKKTLANTTLRDFASFPRFMGRDRPVCTGHLINKPSGHYGVCYLCLVMSDDTKTPPATADPRTNYWPGGDDEVITTLPNGVKVKRRMLRMRACTEKDAKDKMCRGHIKRWFDAPPEVTKLADDSGEIYRCERCKTVYLPNPGEAPRTQTLAW